MKRKYPAKMFWRFVLADFVFHFLYLFLPGAVLCVVGIRVRPCLWIGLILLGVDLALSIAEQTRIRKAAEAPSANPEFNELMDAFCGPGGLGTFGEALTEKSKSPNHPNSPEEN